MSSPGPSRRRWFLYVLLLLLLLAVGFALTSRQPGGIERRLQAIRAQGLPATAEELDRSLGTNAAIGQRNSAMVFILREKIRVDQSRTPPTRGTSASAEEVDWARRQLAGDNPALFDELHEQLQQAHWRYASLTGGLMNASIGHLGDVKGLANALQIEALAAVLAGDTNRSAQALLAGLRVGRTIEPGARLIEYLVRIACDAISARTAENVFSRAQLPQPELAALQRSFRAAEGTNALSHAFIGERAFGVSAFRLNPAQMAAAMNPGTGGSASGGTQQPFGKILYALYSVFVRDADFVHYLDQMERLVAIANLSGPPARTAMSQLRNDQRSSTGDWRWLLSRMTLPALSKAAEKEWRHVANMRCARTGCAVERFRAVHDTLPASLDELVPEFLEAVPSDPMDGKPLKYRRLDRGYVVYSVGEDDKDDGGVEYANRKNQNQNQGGWDYTFTVER